MPRQTAGVAHDTEHLHSSLGHLIPVKFAAAAQPIAVLVPA